MAMISEKARQGLKKPLGRLFADAGELPDSLKGHKIVAVGDICTLALIDIGLMPHLAVFDHRYKRQELDSQSKERISAVYPNPKIYENPAGELSEKLVKDAARLLDQGGGVLIIGEDDLTALAFIEAADESYVIVYGQPDEGIVLVRPDKKTKDKVRLIIEYKD